MPFTAVCDDLCTSLLLCLVPGCGYPKWPSMLCFCCHLKKKVLVKLIKLSQVLNWLQDPVVSFCFALPLLLLQLQCNPNLCWNMQACVLAMHPVYILGCSCANLIQGKGKPFPLTLHPQLGSAPLQTPLQIQAELLQNSAWIWNNSWVLNFLCAQIEEHLN